MSFLSCFSFEGRKKARKHDARRMAARPARPARSGPVSKQQSESGTKKAVVKQRPAATPTATATEKQVVGNGNIAAQTFSFRELAVATKNFRPECLIGEGGFGRVYKGRLENTGQVVAVKQLDRNGLQGNREFLVEVLMLSLLRHNNLVNLIGYCADGDQRLLVYEYMALGSLEDHLLDTPPLSWFTRMKIAFGAAKGLEYLHEKANPPVIYRDLKSSNILLNEDHIPKLSDFGLAKLVCLDEKANVSSRVMGTYGYCAPEYARTGQLSVKSDVYSFGVVLLELITGKSVIDTMRPTKEQNLVALAQPILKDQKRYSELIDPRLKGNFPLRGLNQAVAVAAMCLQEEASVRPVMADVVVALRYLQESPINVVEERCHHLQPLAKSGEDDTPDVHGILDEETAIDRRRRVVAEAIRWGSNNSRDGQRSRCGTGPL